MIPFESRACGVLYNLLRSLAGPGPFLLPANVCPVVPLTLRAARRRFHLVDIAPDDLALRRDACLDLVARGSAGVAGVLFVQPYGAEVEVEPFFRELKRLRPELLVIDDRGLGPPDWDGHGVTGSADVTLFSTGSRKQVDLGVGGFAHVKAHVAYRRHERPFRPEALERDHAALQGGGRPARALRRGRGGVARPAAGAAVLGGIPPARPPGGADRRAPAARERHLFAAAAAGGPAAAGVQGWRFNILVDRPHELVARLFAAGLFASRHYADWGRFSAPAASPTRRRCTGESSTSSTTATSTSRRRSG